MYCATPQRRGDVRASERRDFALKLFPGWGVVGTFAVASPRPIKSLLDVDEASRAFGTISRPVDFEACSVNPQRTNGMRGFPQTPWCFYQFRFLRTFVAISRAASDRRLPTQFPGVLSHCRGSSMGRYVGKRPGLFRPFFVKFPRILSEGVRSCGFAAPGRVHEDTPEPNDKQRGEEISFSQRTRISLKQLDAAVCPERKITTRF